LSGCIRFFDCGNTPVLVREIVGSNPAASTILSIIGTVNGPYQLQINRQFWASLIETNMGAVDRDAL